MTCCDKILDATLTLTSCNCPPEEGLCPVHNCIKTAHWKFLCRTNAEYFAGWREGRAPCLQSIGGPPIGATPAGIGLGDVVAGIIKFLTLGKVTMCAGCQSRRTWLNRFRLWPPFWKT